MEIDSHILGLSMEFEKQNIIITEWETEKAKTRSDNIYERRKRKRIRKRQPKIYLDPTDSEPNDDEEEEDYDDCDDAKNDDNESGFEVRNVKFSSRITAEGWLFIMINYQWGHLMNAVETIRTGVSTL